MISFTYNAISEVVMARLALRHHLHPDRPAMLTDDHREAIDLMIDGAFGAVCLGMIPYVTDMRSSAPDDTLELEINPADREGEVRVALEASMVSYVLHLAFEGTDPVFAAEMLSRHAEFLEHARSLCGASAPKGALRPCWL